MPDTSAQTERRNAIVRLLRAGTVGRQSELVERLRAEGIEATQSSVSRDLRSLGVVREAAGYRLPESAGEHFGESLQLIADLVRSMRGAGPNLLVIRTATGAAQRVGLVLDRLNLPEIVGTLSGDDTIFVATANKTEQRRLLARLEDRFRNAQ